MKIKLKLTAAVLLLVCMALFACGLPDAVEETTGGSFNIVATTTLLADLCREIGKEHVVVVSLMGPGIDPHLYQASAGDMMRMQEADMIVYNGLHLEGKMGDLFPSLSERGYAVVCVGDSIQTDDLLAWEGGGDLYDPHIWFDVSLWKQAAKTVANALAQADPENAGMYAIHLRDYLRRLEEADRYVLDKTVTLPENMRMLVTAHDAFHYFGKAYGFEVCGLQGISTDTEVGTADISALADDIADRQIKAVFLESSVPPKTIEALQAAVRARGFDVIIGGELYSDSLGGEGTEAKDYVSMVEHNIDTIVEALQ
ncbi:MAG: metal ABC transporter solute-binding protein, Zn/Mn family [Christensenellales bacterium]|jgi:manganese/zinc/iron transport system substrate-binding protein